MSDLENAWSALTGNDTKTVTTTDVKPASNTGMIVGAVIFGLLIIGGIIWGVKQYNKRKKGAAVE